MIAGIEVGRLIESVERLEKAAFDAWNTAHSCLDRDDSDVRELIDDLLVVTNKARTLTGSHQMSPGGPTSGKWGDALLSDAGRALERLEERVR